MHFFYTNLFTQFGDASNTQSQKSRMFYIESTGHTEIQNQAVADVRSTGAGIKCLYSLS